MSCLEVVVRSSMQVAGLLVIGALGATPAVAVANDGAFQAVGISIGVRAGFVGRSNKYGRMLPNSQIAPRVALWGEWGDVTRATAGVSYQMGRHERGDALGALMRNLQVDLGAKLNSAGVELGAQGSFSLWPDSDWYPAVAMRFATIANESLGAEITAGVQSQGLPQVTFGGIVMNPDLDDAPVQIRQPPPR